MTNKKQPTFKTKTSTTSIGSNTSTTDTPTTKRQSSSMINSRSSTSKTKDQLSRLQHRMPNNKRTITEFISHIDQESTNCVIHFTHRNKMLMHRINASLFSLLFIC